MTAAQRDRGGDRRPGQDRDRLADRDRAQGRHRSGRSGQDGGVHQGSRAGRAGQDPAAARPGLRAGAAYDGGTASIAAARRFTGAFLDRAAICRGAAVPAAVRGAAQLVVSELVTNACKFAPGPSVLTLEIRGRALDITLWDGEPSPPVVGAAEGPVEPGRIGRHGLEIVFALCTGFGVRREPVGKCVTATLDLLPPAPPGR